MNEHRKVTDHEVLWLDLDKKSSHFCVIEEAKLLMTAPGVGPIVAACFL